MNVIAATPDKITVELSVEECSLLNQRLLKMVEFPYKGNFTELERTRVRNIRNRLCFWIRHKRDCHQRAIWGIENGQRQTDGRALG